MKQQSKWWDLADTVLDLLSGMDWRTIRERARKRRQARRERRRKRQRARKLGRANP